MQIAFVVSDAYDAADVMLVHGRAMVVYVAVFATELVSTSTVTFAA